MLPAVSHSSPLPPSPALEKPEALEKLGGWCLFGQLVAGALRSGQKCLPQGPVSTSPDSVGYQWVRELGSLCPELQDIGAGPTHGSSPVYRWLLAEPGDVFRQTAHLGQSL